jgi:hypothetical protein
MRKLIYCPAIVKAHLLFARKGEIIKFKKKLSKTGYGLPVHARIFS